MDFSGLGSAFVIVAVIVFLLGGVVTLGLWYLLPFLAHHLAWV
jgi:hypothetical protein